MAETKEKPAYMQYLEARGIYGRGYFRFSGTPHLCYSVTRSFQLLSMDGEDARLGENELWERYDELEPVSREEFEAAREKALDQLHASRGQPSERLTERIAAAFAVEYSTNKAAGRWQAICRCDEETIRRIVARAAVTLAGERATQARRQKKCDAIFRDVVLAKVRCHLKEGSDTLIAPSDISSS